MTIFATLDPETGAILRQTGQPPGLPLPDGVRDDTHYYDLAAGAFAPRPAIGVPEVVAMTAGVTLALAVPMGTRATVREQSVTCSDGALHLKIDMPDSYMLHLYPPFPWMPQDVELVVEP